MAILLTLCTALLIAACGGSSSSAGNGDTSAGTALKFAQCMRSHGIPDYPDPTNSEQTGTETTSGSSSGKIEVNGTTLKETQPEFVRAIDKCEKYSPVAAAPKASSAQLVRIRAGALKLSECMRTHGVPNYPDLVVEAGPGGRGVMYGLPGLTRSNRLYPKSPVYQSAMKTCGHLLSVTSGKS